MGKHGLTRDEVHKRLIEVAAESPAKKRKVGAVITQSIGEEYLIVAEGYNYNPSGGPCETEDNVTHENVIHAEVAAIEDLPKGSSKPHKMFVTHPPCDGCRAALLAAEIEFEVMGDFLKFDRDKPRMSLVPSSLLIEVAKVMTYGARKYKVNNWRKVKSLEPYINALERHLAAYKEGEDIDHESKLMHLSHMACNAAFLIELTLKNPSLPKVSED